MQSPSSGYCLHQELGDYLEILRCTFPVQGQTLTINEVCHRAAMSTRTYYKVKKDLARI